MARGEWRIDPTGRFEYRWHDGERYTEYVARDGEQIVDPAGIPDDLPSTVEVDLGPLDRQNRWSVAFRLVLAIPHLVWITLVTVAAVVVLVIGWFAAVFTARLPDGIARFLHQVVRYHVRLLTYLYLLRDDYPPFALGDERYPVVVETRPGPLNRWAVLFRLVLALPVLVLANWLSAGVAVSMIVVWIVVLVKGRMPGMGGEALAAVLRFEARTYGYVMLLATEYPKGLYGDRDPRRSLGTGAKRLITLFLVLGILQTVVNNSLGGDVESRSQSCQEARSSASSCSSTAADRS